MPVQRRRDLAAPEEQAGGLLRERFLGHPVAVSLLILLAGLEATAIVGSCRKRTNQWDFSHYYVSSVAARMGMDPYTSDLTPLANRLGLKIEEINRATNPPTFVLAFEPLTLLSPGAAYWVWFSINLCALAASLLLLLHDYPKGHVAEVCSLVALAIIYPPVGDHFFFAQSQILIMLMLIGMMVALTHGHDALAGLLLAAASLLRIYPLAMVGYLAATDRWRALRYAVVFGVIGALLTIYMFGFGRTLDFTRQIRFLTGPRWLAIPANVSLDGFISRIFWLAGSTRDGVELARELTVVGCEILVLIVTFRISKSVVGDNDKPWWRFSLWIVAMVLLSPTAWPHYLVFLLIPFSCLLIGSREGLVSTWTVCLGLLSAGFVFVGFYAASMTRVTRLELSAILAQLLFLSLALAYVAMYSFRSDIEHLVPQTKVRDEA